ncbi:sialidase family protein [Anoxybacillus rupiensis]|uniref:Sialidase family protein n=1 Tax=Anoxybacteroides rupiense TaxID=311460 RepID=A0ABD5IQW5_9BACL|nr:sialidase family protein [Anoxybacillus rupiensis]
MPTVIDATVVNQAYDTSGNGGRKLVRLSNGWLVAVVFGSNTIYFYKSTDNGTTWVQLTSAPYTTTSAYLSIVSLGTRIYLLASGGGTTTVANFATFDATTVGATFTWGTNVDSGQTAMGAVSLAINSAGTELHAAWASKNSTYPNSFNIRYAKGTINADGSVTWGAVEQVSTINTSGYNCSNPSIVFANGYPFIFADIFNPTTAHYGIIVFTTKYTTKDVSFTSSWGNKFVYDSNSNTYTQSSPSACVAPNGRIWVAWHGTDATDTGATNIRVAYSDDGGTTWSAMTKLTSGNTYAQVYASITVNRNNEVFVLWHGFDASNSYNDIRMIKYSSGSWGSISIIANGTTAHKAHASTLIDTTLDFSTPLFIYQDNQGSKVGFYGTWVVTTISVTPGYIGQKTSTDKSNILSYSITTDGTMSTITEKINGTTIATRTNPTSGQNFTVSLSQAQWDAIKYGNAHTLTIEMNGDTWTYTFDKRLNANDDILSAVKGAQDLQTHLNAIKAQLGAAIRAKGGTVNDTDTWSAFVSAIGALGLTSSKRWARGTKSSEMSTPYLNVSGLSFKPSLVIAKEVGTVSDTIGFYIYADKTKVFPNSTSSIASRVYSASSSPLVMNTTMYDNGFSLHVYATNSFHEWIAFE